MYKQMLRSSVSLLKWCAIIGIVFSYGCTEDQKSDDLNGKQALEETFKATDEQRESLRRLVVSRICVEPGIYRDISETEEDCERRIYEMVVQCEKDQFIRIPDEISESGEGFSNYATQAIACIEDAS